MTINPANKLELSPEARTALLAPLEANGSAIIRADGRELLTVFIVGGYYETEAEIAAFIAALVNAALTPAVEPENNAELRQIAEG